MQECARISSSASVGELPGLSSHRKARGCALRHFRTGRRATLFLSDWFSTQDAHDPAFASDRGTRREYNSPRSTPPRVSRPTSPHDWHLERRCPYWLEQGHLNWEGPNYLHSAQSSEIVSCQ